VRDDTPADGQGRFGRSRIRLLGDARPVVNGRHEEESGAVILPSLDGRHASKLDSLRLACVNLHAATVHHFDDLAGHKVLLELLSGDVGQIFSGIENRGRITMCLVKVLPGKE
jgi:hypothetical protein